MSWRDVFNWRSLRMKGFLTGSRVYGVPKTSSDLDLVLQITLGQLAAFESAAEETEVDLSYGGTSDTVAVRFGQLNLILCTTAAAYNRWSRAQKRCTDEAPITRDRAIEIHKEEGV